MIDNVDKWEYHLERTPHPSCAEGVEGILNRKGSCGWELVAIDYGCFIFKRKLERKEK